VYNSFVFMMCLCKTKYEYLILVFDLLNVFGQDVFFLAERDMKLKLENYFCREKNFKKPLLLFKYLRPLLIYDRY
jgi:hypothetical protein